MIKPFKLLNGYTYSNEYTLPVRIDPPYGISNRHWNMLPQDLRGGEREDMLLYIEGWEASARADYNNPYPDQLRGEVWNRGWHAWFERRNGETYTERDMEHYHADREFFNRRTRTYTERDMEFYNTDELIFFDVTPVMPDPNSDQPYKFMLFRHIEDGNTVQGSRIYPDHYMYNFPDVI
jgi:hypothetical protein